nr:YbaB/EbfC family nucleoid-associated protein [Leptospira ryugenii]
MFDQIKNLKEVYSQMGNIQEKQAELQKRLSTLQVTASSGAGMVEVTANAEGTIVNIKINPVVFVPSEQKLVEDLILSATNEALRKAKEAMAYEMKNVFGFNPKDFESMFQQNQ